MASYLSTQATNTRSVDPMLRGVSRTTDGGLDPRPMAGSPALTSNAPAPDDAFFTNVSYTGAFGSSLWIDGWSALSDLGYAEAIIRTSIDQVSEIASANLVLDAAAPNPSNGATRIRFALPSAQNVRLAVYDLMGREVAVLFDGTKPQGTFDAMVDVSTLAAGTYLYRLTTPNGSVSRALTVVR